VAQLPERGGDARHAIGGRTHEAALRALAGVDRRTNQDAFLGQGNLPRRSACQTTSRPLRKGNGTLTDPPLYQLPGIRRASREDDTSAEKIFDFSLFSLLFQARR